MIPVINNFTLSFRESNCLLYLSALLRAVPLFLAFDWNNYSRWVPCTTMIVFFLKKHFQIYLKDLWKTISQLNRVNEKCSAIPVDQALEKKYNKNAKGKGGIIGFRRKEDVAKWNIIKHEKMQYLKFLDPFSANFTKWLNTLKQFVGNLPTNCLSVWPFCEIGTQRFNYLCNWSSDSEYSLHH